MKKNKKIGYKLSYAMIFAILLLFVLSFFNNMVSGHVFLNETLPHFAYFSVDNDAPTHSIPVAADIIIEHGHGGGLIGLGNVVFEELHVDYDDVMVLDTLILEPHLLYPQLAELRDPYILMNRMYTLAPQTSFLPHMFDVDFFMEQSMAIDREQAAAGNPVVLIFHTHSTEFFADSYTGDMFSGIVGVGAYLAQLLNNMGIPTMHLTDRFDIVDGRPHILGAYERQVPRINQVLADNPSIEVVIDMHRDGLPEGAPRLVTYIEGRPTAQIMFFNGLSLLNQGGVATPIEHLPNPYLPYNLAMSFQMQMAANQLFPGFTRRIFLHAFRYSLHFRPRSILLEVGAQTSYFHEAINAMYPFAQVLSSIIKPYPYPY